MGWHGPVEIVDEGCSPYQTAVSAAYQAGLWLCWTLHVFLEFFLLFVVPSPLLYASVLCHGFGVDLESNQSLLCSDVADTVCVLWFSYHQEHLA
jgi:hypothetical protein